MYDILIIGGGAAGCLAGIGAATYFKANGRNDYKIAILEKNEKIGKKIFITGKGRCNITNDCDNEDFFKNVKSNPKFMYSSLYGFDHVQIVELIEKYGTKTKVERGGRVFPVSDHSSDVIKALDKALKSNNVELMLNTEVKDISKDGDTFEVKAGTKTYESKSLIICTGGKSYAATGSTGDGYRFAKDFGLEITDIYPGLVPYEVKETDYKEVQGLALKNVEVHGSLNGKEFYMDRGEMLFTHFGLSGPLILSMSESLTAKQLGRMKDSDFRISIDLKPALDQEALSKRVLRDFDENKNKSIKNVVEGLMPKSLALVYLGRLGIDGDTKVNSVTKEQRNQLVYILKHLEYTVTGDRGFDEAIITKGGIKVKEINPSTMEAKKVQGLFAAGELLDVDAFTGGYNLQIAWSTGYAAGEGAAEYVIMESK